MERKLPQTLDAGSDDDNEANNNGGDDDDDDDGDEDDDDDGDDDDNNGCDVDDDVYMEWKDLECRTKIQGSLIGLRFCFKSDLKFKSAFKLIP